MDIPVFESYVSDETVIEGETESAYWPATISGSPTVLAIAILVSLGVVVTLE